MRTPFILILAAFAFVMAACGTPDKTDTTTPSAQGTQATKTPPEKKPITEEELGLKFYPGGMLMESQATDVGVMAKFETTDSADKAASFYEAELGSKTKRGPMMMIGGKKNGHEYQVVIDSANGKTSISILGDKKK